MTASKRNRPFVSGVLRRAVLVALCLAVPAVSAPVRSKVVLVPIVAVFDIEAKGIDLSAQVLDNLADYLATRLAESGRYQVVPRPEVKSRLAQEQNEAYKKCYDESCQIEMGKDLAANKSLATRIVALGSQCTVNLNVFDLGLKVSDAAATASGACTEDGIVASLDAAVSKLTGTAGAAGTGGARGDGGRVGGGTMEGGVTLDRGEAIENTVTDQTGYVVIKTDPEGATVTLNGQELGQAPVQVERMVGRYVAVAEMGRLYHPARQEFDLTTAGTRLTLTLLPAFGRLEVSSDPSGAEVWLDGEKAGTTPWSADRKPSGTYQVRLVKANHLTRTDTVTVADGRTTQHRATLDQNFGTLRVESDPPGAAITLNDQPTGRVTPTTFEPVQPGLVVVKLGLEGYGEAVERATVENRRTASIRGVLQAKKGLLAVTSAYDDGALCEGEVSINGRVVGTTPWKGEVIATRHVVKVACPKGSAEATVDVPHNGRRDVAVIPKKVPQVKPLISPAKQAPPPSSARPAQIPAPSTSRLWRCQGRLYDEASFHVTLQVDGTNVSGEFEVRVHKVNPQVDERLNASGFRAGETFHWKVRGTNFKTERFIALDSYDFSDQRFALIFSKISVKLREQVRLFEGKSEYRKPGSELRSIIQFDGACQIH